MLKHRKQSFLARESSLWEMSFGQCLAAVWAHMLEFGGCLQHLMTSESVFEEKSSLHSKEHKGEEP